MVRTAGMATAVAAVVATVAVAAAAMEVAIDPW
jgi:hypothetical protein